MSSSFKRSERAALALPLSQVIVSKQLQLMSISQLRTGLLTTRLRFNDENLRRKVSEGAFAEVAESNLNLWNDNQSNAVNEAT
jgi:hypothetical protein